MNDEEMDWIDALIYVCQTLVGLIVGVIKFFINPVIKRLNKQFKRVRK